MTATNFTDITDQLAKSYLRIMGNGTTLGGGLGPGVPIGTDYGISKSLRDVEATVTAIGEYEVISSLIGPLRASQDAASNSKFAMSILGPILSSLNGMAYIQQLTGIFDVASLVRFWNVGAGGTWASLLAPEFGDLWFTCAGSRLPASYCLYAPADITLASRVVGSGMVAGTAVDSTRYAGAARAAAVITGWAGTSGTLTVTGVARPKTDAQDIDLIAGRTFTGTVTGNGTVYISPSVAGDLLVQVTAISLPAGMSAGTVTIKSALPTSRTAPTI